MCSGSCFDGSANQRITGVKLIESGKGDGARAE